MTTRTRLTVLVAVFACIISGIASASVINDATKATKAWSSSR